MSFLGAAASLLHLLHFHPGGTTKDATDSSLGTWWVWGCWVPQHPLAPRTIPRGRRVQGPPRGAQPQRRGWLLPPARAAKPRASAVCENRNSGAGELGSGSDSQSSNRLLKLLLAEGLRALRRDSVSQRGARCGAMGACGCLRR